MNASMTGRMLAHYRVESLAGTGGMGAVYRAYDTRLRRHVAIKLLTGTGQDDPGRRAVLREARAASRLNHPNICAVYEVGEADGQPFIVMELVEGRILSGIMAAGSLPVETVLHIGMQVAGALDHAHGHGIVHRDLKPGNVAMTAEGRVKILDFGIAAALPRPDGAGDTIEATRTADGAIAGTPAYMSPEAFRGESPRESADIWALGVLLYEMATGRRPFRGESAAELVSAILRDPVTVPAELPVGLRPVVLRCLQKEPAQRYGSAAEVRAALEAVAATLEHETPGRRGAPSAPTLIAVAVALLLATAGAALWWGARSPDSLEPANFRLLSTFPGAHRSATLSPDGGQLAFLDVEQEVPQVWVKNLREGDPIQVTSGSVPALRPRWAPAGDRIVFARRGAGIWEVSSLGGPERRLIGEGANPHLSADGRLMVFERGVEIWIAAADGSGERRVDGVPRRAYTVDLSPAISPDGSLIAFFVSEIGPNEDFWVISSAGGEARRLTHDVTEGGTPDWTPDGRRIVFSSARGGSHTLWSISPDGGTPEPLTTGAGEDRDPVISSDGGTLLYTNVRNSWSLMLADAAGGERRLTQSRSGILWPMVSPDGSVIAYFGPDGRGSVHIFTVTLGGEVRQITRNQPNATEINTMPRWGGDSEHLYYYQQRPENSFRRMPVLGGPSVQIAPWTWEIHFAPTVHPRDGRLAYLRRDRQPPVSLVFDPGTGTEVEVPQLLFDLSWSGDGQFLLGAWQNRIYLCDAASLQRCTPLTAGTRPTLPADGARLYFFRPGPSPLHREIWVRDMVSGAERPLRTIGPQRWIDIHFHVSPQGDLVWAPFQEGRHELWMAELR